MDTEVDTPSTELEEMMLSDWFIYKINSKRFPSSSANIHYKSILYIDNKFQHTNLHTNRILLKPKIKSLRIERPKIY